MIFRPTPVRLTSRIRGAAVLALATATLSTLVAGGAARADTARPATEPRTTATPAAPTAASAVSLADPKSQVIEDKKLPVPSRKARSGSVGITSVPRCDGNGTSGPRVQLLYVRGDRQPDRLEQFRAEFQSRAVNLNSKFVEASERMGERREVRFVHDANCRPTITRVVVPQAAIDGNGEPTQRAVVAQGYNSNDRKYLVWAENNVCGLGFGHYDDQRPGQENFNNTNAGWPMVGMGPIGCFDDGANVDVHEVLHTMGAVQSNAPKSNGGGAHCYVQGDLMCYNDGRLPNPPGRLIPCDYPERDVIDCNRDMYFNPRPRPGSYLDRNWNIANSRFLIRGGGSTNPVPAGAQLRSAVGGWAADVDMANTANGTKVKAEVSSGHQAQRWNLDRLADSRYRITPALDTGKALDSNTDRSRVVDGTSHFAQIWSWGNGENQKWTLRQIAGGRYEIVGNDGGCLTASRHGAALGVWSCDNTDSQRWTLAP
ncbi:RICIN domain-containing protein [Streptomyces yaizuensis]|uniref:RICIN domain-containing protein n=1 Tax=Streptomyces yaizuensis TaxID=2989713 RepID=A0ABQ5PAG3_9ACTN|nr:RICIN domain-containing protein [Streptomyces sp. YSPA8]GLF99573.1 RICIN domain-containing protein [Streptomyces sp. YSPA8]